MEQLTDYLIPRQFVVDVGAREVRDEQCDDHRNHSNDQLSGDAGERNELLERLWKLPYRSYPRRFKDAHADFASVHHRESEEYAEDQESPYVAGEERMGE